MGLGCFISGKACQSFPHVPASNLCVCNIYIYFSWEALEMLVREILGDI